MNEQQIKDLFQHGHYPFREIMQELIETHISWVLLGKENVYKIKKPLKLSFLDFSTLEKRMKYCDRELELNKRLAPEMYLDVVPVTHSGEVLSIAGPGEIIDYAVRMTKMDNRQEMRKLLVDSRVTRNDIKLLADQISDFHQTADVIFKDPSQEDLLADFNDIVQIEDFTHKMLGSKKAGLLQTMIEVSTHFIDQHIDAIQKRSRQGFVRDCHGDLHSGNIFLTNPPVIFDCIEFNDHFRHIDILNEVAFFCMDLEFYGAKGLSQYFMKEYVKNMQIDFGQFEQDLFSYYKFYRANVKTKVNAIKSMQESAHDTKDRGSLFKQYFNLMEYYYKQLVAVSL